MNPIIHHSYKAMENGRTVEELLRSLGYSKSLINRIKLTDNGLLIHGEKVYTTHHMQPGERLEVTLPQEPSSEHIVPTPMSLSILYEDEDLMVINKAANVPIHPSQGNFSNSLANGLAWYFEQKQQTFVFRAINRLDRDTSGALVLAKNALSAAILSAQMRNREIRRTYLAVVRGVTPPSGTISAPIGRVSDSVIQRQVDPEHGEAAVTHYERLAVRNDHSLLEIHLETGRTHQIRVHMGYIGHPLPADYLYCPVYDHFKRQPLHSYQLNFRHPLTGKDLCFTAPVPHDMTRGF